MSNRDVEGFVWIVKGNRTGACRLGYWEDSGCKRLLTVLEYLEGAV